jgi:hypothetical protein
MAIKNHSNEKLSDSKNKKKGMQKYEWNLNNSNEGNIYEYGKNFKLGKLESEFR